MKYVFAALGLLAGALPARAQSFNVDFEPASSPFGTPTPYYGGSAQMQGYWDSVSSTSVSGLRGLDGTPTGVSLTLSPSPDGEGCMPTSGGFAELDLPFTTGEDQCLLDDNYHTGVSLGVHFTFQGLVPGDYVVDTITGQPYCKSQGGIRVQVLGSPDPTAVVSGAWPGSYAEGVNYARHRVTVTDGTITIELDMVFFTEYMHVAGLQLRLEEQELPDGIPFCFGDGSMPMACPCSNNGLAGRGCENSIGTGGAVLFATGTTSPDTVVLHAYGERPTSLSIVLQGNAPIGAVPYGDGLRCTGGTLRRLYTRNASAGELSAPRPGDPSITLRSSQLGVPIVPPERRSYQVYYRDGAPGFCPPPQGSSFNVTNAVEINW